MTKEMEDLFEPVDDSRVVRPPRREVTDQAETLETIKELFTDVTPSK